MKFGISILAGALFILTACATTNGLRQGVPDLDEMTNIPPERVAGCIGDKFDASSVASQNGQARLSSRPTANGYSISEDQVLPGIYSGGTDTFILVDISKVDDKTHVQLFTHFLFPAGSKSIIPLVRGCL